MGIRRAILNDHSAIKSLLDQLDYPGSEDFIKDKMSIIMQSPERELLVYELEGGVVGFIILEFLPQLGLRGDIARIGYFAVDQNARGKGIGAEMEGYIESLARERHCDRIEVHCHARRIDAHRFYLRQGYFESPKYFMKKIAREKE
jgi:GNAT superfamily N-acetyltransferase